MSHSDFPLLRFRKRGTGGEQALVDAFLSAYEDLFQSLADRMAIFNEPGIGSGFPDLVLVLWDSAAANNWAPSRGNLDTRDIKVLHHLAMSNSPQSLTELRDTLRYPQTEKIVRKLLEANVILESNHGFSTHSIESIFFVRSIITIEAKLTDWKSAFHQSGLNAWFSSESYVMLPENRISQAVLDTATESGSGLIGFGGESSAIFKESAKRAIPVSYSSWLFNEHLGRQIAQTQRTFV